MNPDLSTISNYSDEVSGISHLFENKSQFEYIKNINSDFIMMLQQEIRLFGLEVFDDTLNTRNMGLFSSGLSFDYLDFKNGISIFKEIDVVVVNTPPKGCVGAVTFSTSNHMFAIIKKGLVI